MRFIRMFTAAAILALGTAGPAAAQYAAIKGMDERFRLDVGGFFQKFDTTLRYDATNGATGSTIDFEGDLGGDSHQTNFRADGYWRFGRHGRFEFGYRGWNRTADH